MSAVDGSAALTPAPDGTAAQDAEEEEYERTHRETATPPDELRAALTTDVADAHGAQDALRRWLQSIPARHAEVFQMTQEVFSDQQIADTLGITERSVHSYRALALKRLRELAASSGHKGESIELELRLPEQRVASG
ncbi:RNA polymerase sigma factor [Paractinoplanes lichenicola]|uniref:RNA polymerase sigma factor 70 region 4 type 2 domain-containing protein n=1 Tax=Paractinoplanes lichenicola TaxID=2802976 RepID=A0ABS1W195_9ACTN|nr:sigma factor-like helix-turn-helix DNA-binding protein [Actinoplanes lichenicola]MBL7260497.1 hypothetical protein [Actinoplanes lichenicola]